jgi:hypothetical protein
MTAEPMQLPIFVITGANWTMEVQLDEYNAQFDTQSQVLEAASRAIETLEMQREDYYCVMNADSQNEKPEVGTTILVHPKGSDPDNAAIIFTHVCFANMGLYEKSRVTQALLDKQIAELRAKAEAQEKQQQQIAKDLKNFDQLKKDFPKKRKKKEVKPEENGGDVI